MLKTFLSIAIIAFAASAATAQTSAFTYQGKLTDAGLPANGSYDLSFRLFNAQSGGSQVGTDQVKEDVTVTAGIFTVVLDFGTSPFTSNSGSYLEISVRPGSSTGAFTALNPRQPITSSPYAVQTIRADSAALADNANALGGVPAAQFTQNDDPRLSDARPPTAGSPNYIQNGTGVQPLSNFNISGDGSAAGTLTGGIVRTNSHFGIGDERVLAINNFSTLLGVSVAPNLAGSFNTIVGRLAGINVSSGTFNTFLGEATGNAIGSQSRNTLLGAQSGPPTAGGSDVTNIGFMSRSGPAANNSTAIGSRSSVTQSNSLVLGSIAGENGATASTNVGIGTTAPSQQLHVVGNGLFTGDLTVNGTLNATIPITGSYIHNTTNQQATSNFNISGNGTVAGTLRGGVIDATTQFNINGNRLLRVSGTVSSNTILGVDAGLNPSGDENTIMGVSSGRVISSGSGNTALGAIAGSLTNTGSNNTFVGAASAFLNSAGSNNTFVGRLSGRGNSTGNDNVAIGHNTGSGNGTGSNNTFLGSTSDAGADGLTNATAIGAFARVSQSNSVVLGSINGVNGAPSDTNVGIGTTAPSFRFHVRSPGQDGIKIQHTGTGSFPQIRWTDSSDVFRGSIGVDTGGTGSMNFHINGSDRLVLNANGLVRAPGGIFIANPSTLVITSPDGACWGITVSNAGALSTFTTPCP